MFFKLLPEILRYITTTAGIIVLFFALSRPKYKVRLYIIIALVIVAIDATICTIFSAYGNLTAEIFYSIPFYVVLICGVKFLFKDNILQWAFNCVTVYTLYVIVFFASYYLAKLMPMYGYGRMVFRLVLFSLVILFFYKVMRPLYLEVSENWGIFILPITGILINFIYLLISEGDAFVSMDKNMFYFFFLTAVTVLTYIAVIGTIFSTKKKQAIKEENQKRKANEDMLLSELNSYYDFVKLAKENRHDMRHHNAVLTEYLNNNNIEGAKFYLSEHNKSINSGALTEFCKNPLTNAVLRVYKKRIAELGIDFIIDAEALSKLPFTIIETSALLSNILENALEATKVCNAEKKFIKLFSAIKGGMLTLEIENSANENKEFTNGLPHSTKVGGGTGLKSVTSIIQKYGGILNIKQMGGVFNLRIVVTAKQENNIESGGNA